MRQDAYYDDVKFRLRTEFFAKMDFEILLSIFNYFCNTCFFIKDIDGRLIAANSLLLKRYNLDHESDIVGKTDFDFVPQSLAEKYKKDDRQIIESKIPMLNILELALNPLGTPGWFVTNKIPIITEDRKVIGIMGTISKVNDRELINDTNNLFYRILDYIDKNCCNKITVNGIAKYFNVSTRCIQRYFKQYLNISPDLFIIQTRIFKSCDHLRRGRSISLVAEECGFYDQSSFSKHFKKHMGFTPMQYLKKFNKLNTEL